MERIILCWQTQIARSLSLCKSLILSQLCPCSLHIRNRKGHGTNNSSGSSTPFSGTRTPEIVGAKDDTIKAVEHISAVSEKLRHRESFQKARIVSTKPFHTPTNSLSKEHQEQGQVKAHVYRQYIQAASKTGFCFFVFTAIAQQAASVFATLTLRYWGEHNRDAGSNNGMFKFLLVYGLFSLSSTLLGVISAITMWVYCALRSARRLHDSVSMVVVVPQP